MCLQLPLCNAPSEHIPHDAAVSVMSITRARMVMDKVHVTSSYRYAKFKDNTKIYVMDNYVTTCHVTT